MAIKKYPQAKEKQCTIIKVTSVVGKITLYIIFEDGS